MAAGAEGRLPTASSLSQSRPTARAIGTKRTPPRGRNPKSQQHRQHRDVAGRERGHEAERSTAIAPSTTPNTIRPPG